MAGRRVARRRLASFVQQLDGSGGGSLLLARRQKSVVAKIGGVIKDGRGIIALGDYTIMPGDRIVVCCLPRSLKRIERLFL